MLVSRRPPLVAGLRLARLVGQGGEGEVWEAHTSAGERRAVKLVRPEAVAAPDQVAIRGDWLRRIDHPALVRVRRTAMLSEDGLAGWGLVEMDFVDGEDLSAARPRRDALDRLRTLADGLDLLHRGAWSNGTPLVHRDVKPANLIATPDGRVVLVDCSSLCGADRTLLTRIGTPLFAAPEVITGRIGPPADVYSFAATAVALMTGARGDVLLRYLEQPWMLDVPEAVRVALDRDPSRRPKRCADLLAPQHLGRATTPWGSPPASRPAGTPRWADDDRWLPVATSVASDGNTGAASEATSTTHASPEPLRLPAPTWLPAEPISAIVPAPPPPRQRAVWPFLTLLAGVTFLLAGAALNPSDLGVPWTLTAIALSVVAHLGAGRRPWGAVAVPTVAWAFLLAERASRDEERRAWARATVTGALTGALALGWAAIGQTGAGGASQLLVVDVVAAYGITVLTVMTARGGAQTVWGRLVLVPLTMFGALTLLAAAAVTAPLGMFTDALPKSRWLARQSLRACRAIAVFGHQPIGGSSNGSHQLTPAAADQPQMTQIEDDWSVA